MVFLAVVAVRASSPALAGFGFGLPHRDRAPTVVVWELNGTREQRALRLIGWAFLALAGYMLVQVIVVVAAGSRLHESRLGVGWTAVALLVMLTLAAGKTQTGAALGNEFLRTEGRLTLVDAYLAGSVLAGLVLNAWLGWWRADPAAGVVIVFYGLREAHHALGRHGGSPDPHPRLVR